MYLLRIEHAVPDFEKWKKTFDSDPIGRKRSGVRRHRVLRAIDDPNEVMIDLEFDQIAEAEAMLAALRIVWERLQGQIVTSPETRILESVETRKY
jgi:hypothetical protein